MGPHLTPRSHVNLDISMASLRERLEALYPRDGNGSYSRVDEIKPLTGAELTNFLLLQLLQKQGKQL